MTLGVSLALLGGVVLVLLALHGWWTTRRLRPRPPPDSTQPAERIDPSLDPADAVDTVPIPLRPAPRPPLHLDTLVDAVVPLTLDGPVTGEFIIAHLPPSRRAGNKPFYIEALEAASGEWEMPAPGHRYSALQAGVQMASRSGPINEIEYSEFMQKVQAFAETIGANVEVAEAPDMLDVVARARELDALTSPLDVQLIVTLRTQTVAWSVGFVQQVAARHGFVPGAVPGRLVLPAAEEGAPPVLVLAVDAQAALSDLAQGGPVRECTLTLDVPQTAKAAEPFPAWHRAATQLAEDLDAVTVDDQGRPVTLHAFDHIGKHLEAIYQRLEELDLAAGSPVARRLFS